AAEHWSRETEGFLMSTGLARYVAAGAAALAVMIAPATATAATVAGAAPVSQTAAQASYVPAQFIAKLYTEGLGRMPDQSGWQSATTYFAQNGCSAASLAAYGE